MKIQKGIIETENQNQIIEALYQDFSALYDGNIAVKNNGILNNIFQIASKKEEELQNIIAYLAEQVNPESSENIWQDKVYERIGVSRIVCQKAILQADLTGEANSSADKNSIRIRPENSDINFTNTSEVIFNSEGKATANFCADKCEEFKFEENLNFKIINAPSNVIKVLDNTIIPISLGRNNESDDEFRTRFRYSKALNAKATHKANIANLNKYVDNEAFLKILDKNSSITMDPYTVEIIAKHNTTDNIFAQAIFDTFGSGILFQGDISVVVKDILNQNVTIKFTKATEIPININIRVKISEGFTPENVITKIKNSIFEYTKKRIFGLQSIIYATEFIVPTYFTEGVENVISATVKRDTDGEYTDILNMELYEVPEFTLSGINLEVIP